MLWASVACTGMILPLLWLLERVSGSCPDGLCMFFPALLVSGACLLSALAFAVAGLKRGERPRWIALLSIPLLATMIWFYSF